MMMQNADTIRRRLDEVKTMKSYTEALTVLADIQFEIGMQACAERSQLRKEVEQLRKVIMGNGHPEKSLVSRVGVLERCFKECSEKTGTSMANIEKALLGDKKEPGMFERIREIERMKDGINNVKWVMISVVVGQFVLLLIRLLSGT
jgi:hypothetical protein